MSPKRKRNNENNNPPKRQETDDESSSSSSDPSYHPSSESPSHSSDSEKSRDLLLNIEPPSIDSEDYIPLSSEEDNLSSLSGSNGSDHGLDQVLDDLIRGFENQEEDDDQNWIVSDNDEDNPPNLGGLIVIPLGNLFRNTFVNNKNRDSSSNNRNEQNGNPPHTNLRKRVRIPIRDENEPPKKKIKRNKVDILDEIKTLDDMLVVIDKYEDQPNLEYSIDMTKFKALKEPLTELKKMVGLEDIKSQILDQIMFLLSSLQEPEQMLHTVITGSPGCGKTSLGLVLSGIYKALGFSNGKFKIAKRSDLVAGYLGQTTLKTQKVLDDARGGVLFIDEAYSLGNEEGRDSFAKEAIDCINQNLTEMKTELICIIAGYKKQIEECFFSYNPGLSRRFPFRYEIGDYNDRDLHSIFIHMILSSDWGMDVVPVSFFSENYKYFTNKGGDMETLAQMCKITYSRRTFGRHQDQRKHLILEDVDQGIKLFLRKFSRKRTIPPLPEKPGAEMVDVLDEITTLDEMLVAIDKYDDSPDVNYSFDINKFKALKEPLTKLRNMVGIEEIKSQILVQVMYLLSRLQDDDTMLHTVIYGDPGTGKTMLATILSDIYQCLGYSNGKFKTVKGADLVAGYVGQTALKTQGLIDEAKGGILFIDEAYSIGSNSDNGSFAEEALNCLNQNLTELKTELICIIAGYKDKMDKNFFSYNPGLSRRFPFRYEINDYIAKDLQSIFYSKINESNWTIDNIPLKFFIKNFSSFPNRGGDMETLSQMCKIVYAQRTFGRHQERIQHLNVNDVKKAFKMFKKGNLAEGDDHDKFFKEYIKPTFYM